MSAKQTILDTVQTFLDATKEDGWIYHPLDVLIRDVTVMREFARSDAIRENMGTVPRITPEPVHVAVNEEVAVVAPAVVVEAKVEVKEEAPAPAPAPAETKPAAKKTAKAAAAPVAENSNE